MKHAPRLPSRRVIRLLFALTAPALAVALVPGRVLADGAFPDSLGPLLPPDRPNEIILATNFGVVISEDAGQTWTYSCERMTNGMTAGQYQLGPAPRDRLFGLTDVALIYTDDQACTWSKAQGLLAGKPAFDYFPDPGNPNRVWAVRAPDQADAGTNRTYTIVESTDGGATFGVTRYTAAVGDTIAGVEIARSDGNTAYLTIRNSSTLLPKIVVTRDGGASWTTRDLSSRFGTASLRIIAVDPTNPSKIFLRVTNGTTGSDSMALSLDGAASFLTPDPLSVPDGVLNSFVQLPSGTLLVGGIKVVTNVVYRSTNGGTSFQELPAPPVRGLGQRGGRVYIAVATNTDQPSDGYALGVSDDEGSTWQPLMRYDQIQAISPCAKSACQTDCVMKANLGVWDETVCTADPAPMPVDGGAHDAGGTGGRAGTGGAGAGGSHADASADAGTGQPGKTGCGCAAAIGDGGPAGAAGGVVLLLAAALAHRRRRAR